MRITDDIIYVGVDDHEVDLFEGMYKVPYGMAYNSYVILDDKIAVMDTVDRRLGDEWLRKVEYVLNGRRPDFLIVTHMEPDHSANIRLFIEKYPNVKIFASQRAFTMIKQFFGIEFNETKHFVVDNSDVLILGQHVLTFITAPMVHWPEVVMAYDDKDKALFSADAFGKFGTSDAWNDGDWSREGRRYYCGIVGKYGVQVQAVLNKVKKKEIEKILPLHGPVLTKRLDYYLNLYDIWSSYKVESEGVFIAYCSVYGNTKNAALMLADRLKALGCPDVAVRDLARDDMSEAVGYAFRYGKLVLATPTYNADVFPFMNTFIHSLTERNYQKRTIGIIENGSWAPVAAKVIKENFAVCQDIKFTQNTVTIRSALNAGSAAQIEALAKELI